MNEEIEDLSTDDEILRIEGMTAGPISIGKFTLQPMSAETSAWMESAGVWDDEIGNIFKIAAYVMIHASPRSDVLKVVFKRQKFWEAVSDFIPLTSINLKVELISKGIFLSLAIRVFRVTRFWQISFSIIRIVFSNSL